MSEFLSHLEPLGEWHGVDRQRFETDVLPLNEPAILRGLVETWPAVGRGWDGSLAIARYLAGFDNGLPVEFHRDIQRPLIRIRLASGKRSCQFA